MAGDEGGVRLLQSESRASKIVLRSLDGLDLQPSGYPFRGSHNNQIFQQPAHLHESGREEEGGGGSSEVLSEGKPLDH